MGLSICAYVDLKAAPEFVDENDEGEDGDAYEAYYESLLDLTQCSAFEDRSGSVAPGLYEATEYETALSMSYNGYGTFREMLAKAVGYPAIPFPRNEDLLHSNGCWQSDSGPLYELINFSDCEGYLGPEAVAKISRDLIEYREQILAEIGHIEFFKSEFEDLSRVFEYVAAHNGVAVFS